MSRYELPTRPTLWGFVVLGCLLSVLSACDTQRDQAGVVARVNGSPITLAELEAKYDLTNLEWGDTPGPSVQKLKDSYGQVLSQLVVQRLIEQELERRGLAVKDQEVKAREETIRADYPEGAFEQVLVEEYINLDTWRARLKAELAQETFVREVLRPMVHVDYKEAEAYYQAHTGEFFLPPRMVLVVVQGESQELVAKALDHYARTESPDGLAGAVEQVAVNRIRVRLDRVPEAWQGVLKKLGQGKASPVFKEDAVFTSLILLEKQEGKVLDPSQAYPLIEDILVEGKLAQAYDDWLKTSLATARIEITPHLIPDNGRGNGTKPPEERS